MLLRIILVLSMVLIFPVALLRADTVYLTNGRTIEGFVVDEKPDYVQVDVGFGKVGLKRSEIESISRSDEKDSGRLLEKWQRQKEISEARRQEEKVKEVVEARKQEEKIKADLTPKHASISDDRGQIVVDALLNKKINASLILDTGASLVVIKDSVARQLGMNPESLKASMKIKLADGRDSLVKHAVLSSVSVQGAEAVNVDVAILPPEVQDPNLKDGLLGMTYLKNFNFKLDQKNKKLSLERF